MALAAHPFLFLYVVVAAFIILGGVTVELFRRRADRKYFVALALFAALLLVGYWVLID